MRVYKHLQAAFLLLTIASAAIRGGDVWIIEFSGSDTNSPDEGQSHPGYLSFEIRFGLLDCDGGGSGSASRGFLDFAVANAGRADTDALAGTFNNCVNRLEVQIPATFGDIVCVAHTIAELRSATANFTNSRHLDRLPPSSSGRTSPYFSRHEWDPQPKRRGRLEGLRRYQAGHSIWRAQSQKHSSVFLV